MISNKIHIGVIGSAGIAERSVIPAIQSLPEYFRIKGVASRSSEKAQKTGKKFGIQGVETYEELLAMDDLDAVYIPLPTGLHAEWIRKALWKGLHVLSEKSMVRSVQEAEELTHLAKTRDLVLMENFQFRFHRQMAIIQNMIKKGEMGTIRSIRVSFGFPPFSDQKNIRYSRELGGGALLDAGVYPIKVSQILMGDDIDVVAATLETDEELGVDLAGSGLISDRKSKLTSHIAFGFDHFYQCGIDLWGSKGRLYTNRLFTAGKNIHPVLHLETAEKKRDIIVEKDDHFKNMLIHFHGLITNGSRDQIDLEYNQNVRQAKLIGQFRKLSHES